MMRYVWKDTFEDGRLMTELVGSRVRARVLVLPITYGRKPIKSGIAFQHGESYGVANSLPEAKAIVEKIAERKERRT